MNNNDERTNDIWLAQIHTDSQPLRSGLEQLSGFVSKALSSSVLRAEHEQRVKKIVLWPPPHLKIMRWNTGRRQGIFE
jgi:hypothetical protein